MSIQLGDKMYFIVLYIYYIDDLESRMSSINLQFLCSSHFLEKQSILQEGLQKASQAMPKSLHDFCVHLLAILW